MPERGKELAGRRNRVVRRGSRGCPQVRERRPGPRCGCPVSGGGGCRWQRRAGRGRGGGRNSDATSLHLCRGATRGGLRQATAGAARQAPLGTLAVVPPRRWVVRPSLPTQGASGAGETPPTSDAVAQPQRPARPSLSPSWRGKGTPRKTVGYCSRGRAAAWPHVMWPARALVVAPTPTRRAGLAEGRTRRPPRGGSKE